VESVIHRAAQDLRLKVPYDIVCLLFLFPVNRYFLISYFNLILKKSHIKMPRNIQISYNTHHVKNLTQKGTNIFLACDGLSTRPNISWFFCVGFFRGQGKDFCHHLSL